MKKSLPTKPSRLVYFDSLYTEVTNKIRLFTQSNKALSAGDIVWINELVKGFNDKYKNWERDEHVYLDALHKWEGNLFVLCGHAFLHIANDLPIVLANHIDKNLSGPEIAQLKQTYERLREPLTGSVQAKWKKPWMVKLMMFRPFRFNKLFIAWLVNLRSEAWDNGQKIMYAADKEAAIKMLRLSVQQAMLNAKSGSRITFWNRIFELSVYFVLISVVVLFPYEQFGLDITSNLMKANSADRLLGLVIILILFLAGYLIKAGLSSLRRLPVFDIKFEPEKL